jgi:magnesium transporter
MKEEISRGVVLALFIQLIISKLAVNSGSQASTLIIQSMAVGEVHLADWWRTCHAT